MDRREAEEKAEKLVEEAQERVRLTLERARQEAARLEQGADAGAAGEMVRKKGLLEIEKEVREIVARGKKEVDALRAVVDANMDRAVEILVKMVTGEK